MGDIRPEVSKKSPYYIEKYKYYELKYFSMQYDYFKKRLKEIILRSGSFIEIKGDQVEFKDPTSDIAVTLIKFKNYISVIEKAASVAGNGISKWLLIGVTKGIPYARLRLKYDIPCGRNLYYECYRKYFYLLEKLREELQLL